MTNKRNRAETRVRMIDAAIKVFSERGYSGASIEAIARESGMTIGALYSNFSGKRDLFLAALRVSTGQAADDQPPADDGQAVGARSRLLADGTAFLTQVRAQPQRFRLMVWSMMDAANDPEVRSVVLEVLREQRASQERLLDEFVIDGVSPLSPAEGAVALNSMAIGFALQQMVDPEAVGSAEGVEVLRAFVAAIAGTLGTEEPAAPAVRADGTASGAAASV